MLSTMSKSTRHRDSHADPWHSELDDALRGRDRDRDREQVRRSLSRDRRRSPPPASKRKHGGNSESRRSPPRKKEYDMPPPSSRRRSRGRSRSIESRRSTRHERSPSQHRSRRHRHDTSRSPHRHTSSSHHKRRHGSTSPPPKRRRSRSPGHSSSKHSKRSRRPRTRSPSRSSVKRERYDNERERSPRLYSPTRKYHSHKSSHPRGPERGRTISRSPPPPAPPPLPRPQDLPPPPLQYRTRSPGARRPSSPPRRYSPARRPTRYASPPSRRQTPPPPPSYPPVPPPGIRRDHASQRRHSRSPYRDRTPPAPHRPRSPVRSPQRSPPPRLSIRPKHPFDTRSPGTSPRPSKHGRGSPPRRHTSEREYDDYNERGVAHSRTSASPKRLIRDKDEIMSDRDSAGSSRRQHSPPLERARETEEPNSSFSRQSSVQERRSYDRPSTFNDTGYRGRGRARGRGRGHDYFQREIHNGYSQSYRGGPAGHRDAPAPSRRGSLDSYGDRSSPRGRGHFNSGYSSKQYSPDRPTDRRGGGFGSSKTRSSGNFGRGMGKDRFFDLQESASEATEEKSTKETAAKERTPYKDSESRAIPSGPSNKSTPKDESREHNEMPPPSRPQADRGSHSQSSAPGPFRQILGGAASSSQSPAQSTEERKNISFRPFTLNLKSGKQSRPQGPSKAPDTTSSATGSNSAPLGKNRTKPTDRSPSTDVDERGDVRNRSRDSEHMKRTPPVQSKPPPAPTSAPRQVIVKEGSIYHKVSMVGEGTYGKVYKASNNITRELVALKRIRMESEKDGFPITAVREMRLLQALKQENIVSLLEMMVEKNDFYMVFEYMDHDLTGILNHPTFRLERSHIKHLAKQFFQGMHYLHHRGVLHRDIKGSNILLNNEGQLKIADFGLARFYSKNSKKELDYTNRIITLWYRPPEILLGATAYGPAVDMWSAACVFIELFARTPVFQGRTEIDQLDTIYNVMGRPTEKVWPELKRMPWYLLLKSKGMNKHSKFEEKYGDVMPPSALDLAAQLLQYDPAKRPTAEECLQHEYFSEDPASEAPLGLRDLKGDWHEYESKIERRKERDNEKRRRTDAERKKAAERKRQGQQEYDPERPIAPNSVSAITATKRKNEGEEGNEAKRREA